MNVNHSSEMFNKGKNLAFPRKHLHIRCLLPVDFPKITKLTQNFQDSQNSQMVTINYNFYVGAEYQFSVSWSISYIYSSGAFKKKRKKSIRLKIQKSNLSKR